MAEILTPIVIKLNDRGATAVDYIDYFDEGTYGPDKVFFVNRFDTLEKVATQINKCLNLQNTPGSLIHVNRTNIPDKWVEPLTAKTDKYPRRAQYKIRFLLRFKFYGDYAYLDLGAKWRSEDELENFINVTKDDLEVVNTCWISTADANKILNDYILPHIDFEDKTYYDVTNDAIVPLSPEMLAAKEEERAMANAYLIGNDDFILADEDGILSL